MSNIQKVLTAEIQRLARKEVKAATADLRKATVSCRSSLAEFRRRIAALEQENKKLLRQAGKPVKATPEAADEEVEKARITGKMIRSTRNRFGLSQAAFADLVGVHKQSVCLWESKEGQITFRGDTKARVLAVRKMSKQAVREKLGLE